MKRRVYLTAGVLGMIATLPGQTVGISVFADALIDSLALTRVQMSFAYLLGTIASAFLLTPAGRVYDRYGSRAVGTVAAVGLGVSLLVLTQAPEVSAALGSSFLPPAAGALVVMSIGFFLIRFLGQGMLNLVGRTMIMKWYDDRRGAANAVISIAIPLSFSYAPRLLDGMIGAFGWQETWGIMGLVLIFAIGSLALITFRDPQQKSGDDAPDLATEDSSTPIPAFLVPVGRLLSRLGIRRTREPARPYRQYTLSDAAKTPAFWVFNAVVTVSSMLITGFVFHIVAVLAESGLTRSEALAVLLPAAVVSVTIQPLASVASDFMRLKYFAVVHGVSLAVFLGSLIVLPVSFLGYPFLIAAKGIAMAMFGINHIVVWPRFYGTTHLGAVSGFNTACMVAGSALGPYAFSLIHSATGSFRAMAIVSAPVCLLIGIAGAWANNPNRQSAAFN